MLGPGRPTSAVSETRELTLPAMTCRSSLPVEGLEQTDCSRSTMNVECLLEFKAGLDATLLRKAFRGLDRARRGQPVQVIQRRMESLFGVLVVLTWARQLRERILEHHTRQEWEVVPVAFSFKAE